MSTYSTMTEYSYLWVRLIKTIMEFNFDMDSRRALQPLPKRCCADCGRSTMTYALSDAYCSSCISNHCDMSNHLNNVAQLKCNNIHGLICRNNKTLCVGHHLLLLKFCRVCGEPRGATGTLAYDKWYYCAEHKPLPFEQRQQVTNILQQHLDHDVISHICTFLS